MSSFVRICLFVAVALLTPPASAAALASGRPQPGNDIGFLVVAPDRGFLGDEEIRDAFEAFAAERNAALVFVTDERTQASVERALRSLRGRGAQRAVVLPLFLSRSDPRYVRVASLLGGLGASEIPIEWARPSGESYFAVEALADRLRAIQNGREARVLVVGAGARDDGSQRGMLADWQRLVEAASAGLEFESVRAVIEVSRDKLGPALEEQARGATRSVIVPFHLGSKLDGMMSYTASVRAAAPPAAELLDRDVTPDPGIALWMAREANRHTPLQAEDVGVVVMAHGSDYHWNETMREAVAPLATRYKVEPAFSMADPLVIERAVRRLEGRGARFIVILRVFGLAASFRASVERLIGLDVERGDAPDPHAGHSMGHGHSDKLPPARIKSGAVLVTVGGVEDNPLFAEALLSRAQALSHDPAHETIVLVAHGDGDDKQDAHWRDVLASLAQRMRQMGGNGFRAIRTATWREDWPDKRAAAVEEVRTFVREASVDGGRAIVVPARTLGQGPERRFLEGLSFELGEGFAPLPLFAHWAEGEVATALAQATSTLRPRSPAPAQSATPSHPAADR